MSALTNPFVTTTNAEGNVVPVNVENVISIYTIEVPALAGNSSLPLYAIEFKHTNGNTSPQTTRWSYAEKAVMEADFAAIVAYCAEDITAVLSV
jgi:hypothetical protein